jgi:hypothetical protein
MKRKALLAVIGAAIAGFLAALTTMGSAHHAAAQTSSNDVVIMICRADFFEDPPGPHTVSVADTSEGVPTIPDGVSCARALSALFDADFALRDVKDAEGGDRGTEYLLVRKQR